MVTKGGPAVMWACIAWMPIANLYIVGRYIVVKATTGTSHFVVVLCCATIAAVIQSGKPLPGLPNTRVLKSAVVRRVVKFHSFKYVTGLGVG